MAFTDNCNGRGTKEPKRYIVQSRILGERWSDIENARFVELRDAIDYASMCSCYPVIYGMTRVVRIDDHGVRVEVSQTFSAGEGQLKPKHKPGAPPYYLKLRYTVSAAGETWGWLSNNFNSAAEALAFTRNQIFPRNICDVVKLYHQDRHVATYFGPGTFNETLKHTPEVDAFQKHLDDASRIVANMPACKRNCLRMSGNPQVSEPRMPVRNDAPVLAHHATKAQAEDVTFASLPRLSYEKSNIPGFDELIGRNTHLGKTRALFATWFEERFKTKCELKVGLHAAMYEAFRAGLSINTIRPHQS